MAREIGKLTALQVKNARDPGYLSDGAGLYLQVSKAGTKSWVYRWKSAGRLREMGLGALHTFSLQEARQRARDARQKVADGIDPIEARKAAKAQARLEAARAMTFDQCADAYIAAHRAGWRNAKHADQWTNTLRAYASPTFGTLPVQDVDTALVMRALEPIWTTKTETAKRVRGRIERILNWATVSGYRKGENPARWRGHLEEKLAKPSKVKRVQHHPALAYTAMPKFMAKLRKQEGVGALALEFLILTAARTGEVRGATWEEFDLDARTWIVPGERMKAGRPHEVPLPPRAVEIVQELSEKRIGPYVFPGRRPRDPMSNGTLLAVLRRMGRKGLTAHGFRSTFRDWAAECTEYPGEVAEMALAHIVSDKTEAAYRRGTMKEKRRSLLEDWADFCGK